MTGESVTRTRDRWRDLARMTGITALAAVVLLFTPIIAIDRWASRPSMRHRTKPPSSSAAPMQRGSPPPRQPRPWACSCSSGSRSA